MTVLELNRQGFYTVKVVATNGVFESFEFEIKTDSEFIFDVSSNRSDAEKIYSALSKNGVPPCTMLDVVNDML